MVKLLGASKFATTKIEWSFEMGKWTPLWVPFILLLMVHVGQISICLFLHSNLKVILKFPKQYLKCVVFSKGFSNSGFSHERVAKMSNLNRKFISTELSSQTKKTNFEMSPLKKVSLPSHFCPRTETWQSVSNEVTKVLESR